MLRALRSSGEPLPPAERQHAARAGFDFSCVRIHAGEVAADAAMLMEASAFTVGSDIVFGPGQYAPGTARGRELLHHELGHVLQAGCRPHDGRAEVNESADRERQASSALARHRPGAPEGGAAEARVAPSVLQRHPAEKVLRFSARWLSKRTAKHITKHISRHTRAIAGRAVHSVFRNPRALKHTVTRAIREATELVQRHATTAVTQVVEEGTIRVTRQVTRSPGKVRWVVEKTFTEAIGTAGERVLRIVIDQSGRIVTAFPSDRLLAIGLSVAGIEAFTASTAEAAETVTASVEKQAALEKAASEPPESSWWEWVPIVGDLWGSELNSGESTTLAARDESRRRDTVVQAAVADAIADIEADLQTTLGPDKRADVEEFVRLVLASGLDITEDQ